MPLFLFLLTTGAACAQGHYVAHVHVGVHGGASLSRVSFTPGVSEKMLQGFTGGVAVRYAEERHVGIMAELNITQRGWKENFDSPQEKSPLQYSRKLTYIELPVLTHIFFGSRHLKGVFNLGPQVGYMIGNSVSSNFDYARPHDVPGFPESNRMTQQMTMEISNKFDYGITAGAGLEGVIGRRNSIMLEARYYYGLDNLFHSSKKDTFSASRGSSILVTLAYMFRIK